MKGILLIMVGWWGGLLTVTADTGGAARVEVRVAAPAPAFTLAALDGSRFSSTTLTGRAAIVTFWAGGDRPSERQLAELAAVDQQFGGDRVKIVGIVINAADTNSVQTVVAAQRIRFPILVVDWKSIEKFGGLSVVPSTFVIDRNYNVIRHHTGFVDRATLQPDLDAIWSQ